MELVFVSLAAVGLGAVAAALLKAALRRDESRSYQGPSTTIG